MHFKWTLKTQNVHLPLTKALIPNSYDISAAQPGQFDNYSKQQELNKSKIKQCNLSIEAAQL